VISLRERDALHSAYVIGDLGTTYDVHLGLTGKRAPAPVGSQGAWPLNKIWPPARGLARHNKRFTIEEIIANRCQILRPKCTKIDQIVCRLGLRPSLRCGSLHRSPRPPSWIL